MMTTWNELRLVAAEAPRPDMGAVTGRPLVRTESGHLYIIRKVDADAPELGSRISEAELDSLKERGVWLDLSEKRWRARRHCLTVAASQGFFETVERVRQHHDRSLPDLDWHQVGPWEVAYAARHTITAWRTAIAEALLTYVEASVSRHEPGPEALRADLLQNFLLTTERSKERRRTYRNLAVLDRKVIYAISPAVVRLLQREFDLSVEEVHAEVAAHYDALHPFVKFERVEESELVAIPVLAGAC